MLIDTISLELFSHTENWKENGKLILHDRFFMLRDFSFAHKDFLQSKQPYRLQEGRVVIVKKGWADYSFDLVDYHFTEGDMVVFLTDLLIEKHGHSDDFEVDAFSFDFDSPCLPEMNEGFIILHLYGKTQAIVMQHLNLLWELAHEEPFPSENIRLQQDSLLLFIRKQEGKKTVYRSMSRNEDTLRRFIALVSKHAAYHRNIPFFASKLCIAPHYLSTVVKQSSGRTVMQWINQTAVKEIKVWLAYSDETAAEIAHRMNFSCPASLTKFFKRETGFTPSEYRIETRRVKL